MTRKIYFLPSLLLLWVIYSISGTVSANEINWTEKKLGKIIIKAEHAARQKKWQRAIKYGEQILNASEALDKRNDIRYINQLKSLNRYYDWADRLQEVAARVEKAYILSRKHLGISHNTTRISRLLYYKLLVSQKKYTSAIPLVQENISILDAGNKDKVKKLLYLEQILSLYGFEGQLAEQERALLQYLELHADLFGEDGEDIVKTRIILAKNYCRQKKLDKFEELKTKFYLQYICK